MKNKDFNDGICDNCGNTGLANEKCLMCGGVLSKIESDDADPIVHEDLENSEPEVYPLEAIDDEIKGENEDLKPNDDQDL
jgi:hypothetical protein